MQAHEDRSGTDQLDLDRADIAAGDLVQVVRRFTRTVTGDFSVLDLLRELMTSAMRILDADGAGVVVPGPDGLLRLAFASAGAVDALEHLQEVLQDGPCRAAFNSEHAVTVTDLEVDGDWPMFQTRAVELGLHTVCALPLRGRDGAIGVLDLYRRGPRRFTSQELATAGALADLAVSYLAVTGDRDEARRARAELAHRVRHDDLTGLPVRRVFLDALQRALQELSGNTLLAVLFVDLDGLKYANDTYGHLAGDELIRESARRLVRAVGPGDLVARVGGDEFLVLLTGLVSPQDASVVAGRVVQEFGAAADAPGLRVQPSASIGVVVTSAVPGVTAEALVSHADAAMYRAKQDGRGRFALFDPHAYAHATARAGLVPELRAAISAGELAVHYQPIVDVTTGATVAVEALLRWHHPVRGLLTADAFVPAAEHSQLIGPLGAWVLRSVCDQLARWDAAGGDLAPQRVFVNVSVQELGDDLLEERLRRTLAAAGVPPDRVVLEITESGFLDDPGRVDLLLRLHRGGHVLAIDDFGAGYSSLSRLVQLPAQVLKVDRSFTRSLVSNTDVRAVVASVLRLGADLGRDVVVEGVEDEETLTVLRSLGCRYAQGFHLGVPVPADRVVIAPGARTGADPG